jgi:predicted ATPase
LNQPDLAAGYFESSSDRQGNPFFMEEIVRALVEQGVLVRNG